METGTAVLIGAGVVGVVLVGGLFLMNRSQPVQMPTHTTTVNNSGLQGDAAMLFAGLSGGAQILSSIFGGVASINRSNQNRDGGGKPPLNGHPSVSPGFQGNVPSGNPFDYLSRNAAT